MFSPLLCQLRRHFAAMAATSREIAREQQARQSISRAKELTSRSSSASARRSAPVGQPPSWSAAERWPRRCSDQGMGLRRCGPSRTTRWAACRRAAWLEGCISSFGSGIGCDSVKLSECGSLREAREKEEGEERSTSEARARERASEEESALLLRGRGLCAPTSALRAWMSLGRAGEGNTLSLFPLPPSPLRSLSSLVRLSSLPLELASALAHSATLVPALAPLLFVTLIDSRHPELVVACRSFPVRA